MAADFCRHPIELVFLNAVEGFLILGTILQDIFLQLPNVVLVETIFGHRAVGAYVDRPECVAIPTLFCIANNEIRGSDGIAPILVQEEYLIIPRPIIGERIQMAGCQFGLVHSFGSAEMVAFVFNLETT